MSTTPSTSDAAYTVVGGRAPGRGRAGEPEGSLAVVVLNREGRLYREEFLREYHDRGPAEMVYVSGPEVAWDIEARSRQFPAVRFVLLKQEASIGGWINLAMQETRAPLVMVLWSNIRFSVEAFTPDLLRSLADEQAVCVVPRMQTERGDAIPTVHMPVFIRRRPRIVPLAEVRDRMMCLYPYDYCGVYSRERFLRVGGFDPQIASPYWQKLDFGFRCFLWGERIVLRVPLLFTHHGQLATEDTTRDASYKLTYLKNLAVSVRPEGGVLPRRRFPAYLLGSDTGPIASWREFEAARRWVEANRVRFRREARTLADLWELPE
jgi:GT2 family glycosyltransferase